MKSPVFFVATLLASQAAAAATPAISFTGGFPTDIALGANALPQTAGWSFTTSQGFSVTALGIWDQFEDGLLASHRVGIWDAGNQTLLLDASVPAGTATSLINGYRYQSIAPFTLAAGTYVIGALYPLELVVNDNYALGPTFVSSINGLTYGEGLRSANQAGFVLPTIAAFPGGGRFGPNMLLNPAGAVPEPAGWAMLIAGFGLVGAARRRQRIAAA